MSSAERGGGGYQPEESPQQEREPAPYERAARFGDERTASRAYTAAQRAIFIGPPNDLSTYRLQLNRIWHVAVLGEPPPAVLARELDSILAAGNPATLPAAVLAALWERRLQAIRRAPWSERHYRPGQRLD